MTILAIETSCDETAVSLVSVEGDVPHATYTIRGNALFSQVDIHRDFGGVFPSVAKREHIKIITPLFEKVLGDAELLSARTNTLEEIDEAAIAHLTEREPELADALRGFYTSYHAPQIDYIAVTSGPGLEPALWVGVNFARAVAKLYNIPVIPVNHMEGHVYASLFDGERLAAPAFPLLALLISGGHTELVVMHDWGKYEKVGQTRDDAVGEAFDKVARLMDLPYPGGPEISRLADRARTDNLPLFAPLPRPMLDSGDLDFSLSGLKTAVRYAIGERKLTDEEKASLAREFEDAVADVLVAKTASAIEAYGIKSFLVGGGVAANRYIRERFSALCSSEYPDITFHTPAEGLSTDNSIMIALAGSTHIEHALTPAEADTIRASGCRSL